MTDPIESPEAVGERVCDEWCGNVGRDGATLASIIATAIRADRAAVRRATLLDVVLRLEAHDDPWADYVAREFRALATGGSDD